MKNALATNDYNVYYVVYSLNGDEALEILANGILDYQI